MNHDPLHDLFERAAPPSASPAQTRQALDGLRPGFEGALRRHRLRLGAAVTAATVALAGGAAALGALGPGSDADLDYRSPTPDTSIADAEIVEDALGLPGDDLPTEEAPGSDGSHIETVEPTPATAPTVDHDTDEPDDGTYEPDDEAAAPDDDQPPPTTTSTPTTVAPDTDRATGTTPGGSVTVTFDGTSIVIESIDPAPGFTHVLDEETPREVKVYFHGGGQEYEVEIKVEDGKLVIDDEHSGSDEHPDS